MKKTAKQWTADKFRMFVVIALVLNAIILMITEQQKSYWVGNYISDTQTVLAHTEQFHNNMMVRTTRYVPESINQYGKSQDYNYDFTLLGRGKVVLHNEEMPIKTGYHQYFGIDDQCVIVFRSPHRQIINNTSLLCLYN
ncbi:hypothetical protein [Vibrio ponticus]|nr:hypothetical protein [Vibrio ponticus]